MPGGNSDQRLRVRVIAIFRRNRPEPFIPRQAAPHNNCATPTIPHVARDPR